MHGPHQVAQKSTSTTLPASDFWSNGWPSRFVPLISIWLPISERRRSMPANPSPIALISGLLLFANAAPKVA